MRVDLTQFRPTWTQGLRPHHQLILSPSLVSQVLRADSVLDGSFALSQDDHQPHGHKVASSTSLS